MKPLATLTVLAAAFLSLASPLPAQAQSGKQAAAAGLAQTERNAVELRQGMSLGEVQALLGKPRRTSLRDVRGSTLAPSPGTLQWLYSWDDADRASLRVEFAPKAEGAWTVASWEWAR